MKITITTDQKCMRCGREFRSEFPDPGAAISWLQDGMYMYSMPNVESNTVICESCRTEWVKYREIHHTQAAIDFMKS